MFRKSVSEGSYNVTVMNTETGATRTIFGLQGTVNKVQTEAKSKYAPWPGTTKIIGTKRA